MDTVKEWNVLSFSYSSVFCYEKKKKGVLYCKVNRCLLNEHVAPSLNVKLDRGSTQDKNSYLWGIFLNHWSYNMLSSISDSSKTWRMVSCDTGHRPGFGSRRPCRPPRRTTRWYRLPCRRRPRPSRKAGGLTPRSDAWRGHMMISSSCSGRDSAGMDTFRHSDFYRFITIIRTFILVLSLVCVHEARVCYY